MKTMKYVKVLVLLAGLLTFSGLAYAAECDLASSSGLSCLNFSDTGADFVWVDQQTTGTGVIDPFVRIQATGTEQGYNTTADGTFDNGNVDTWNHALLLSDVPQVACSTGLCYEFLLDINESSGGGQEFISLDEIQIYQTDNPDQGVETFSGVQVDFDPNTTMVWRLDDGVNDTILLNYGLNSGSGSGDMFLYVPVSEFTEGTQYVYLYSAFGGKGDLNCPGADCVKWSSSDGFEEWSIRKVETPIPEPATLILLGTGLLGVAGKVRRRMKKS